MNKHDIIAQLSSIHDNLLVIPTSGQGSFVMVECIQALRNIIFTLQKEEEEAQKK